MENYKGLSKAINDYIQMHMEYGAKLFDLATDWSYDNLIAKIDREKREYYDCSHCRRIIDTIINVGAIDAGGNIYPLMRDDDFIAGLTEALPITHEDIHKEYERVWPEDNMVGVRGIHVKFFDQSQSRLTYKDVFTKPTSKSLDGKVYPHIHVKPNKLVSGLSSVPNHHIFHDVKKSLSALSQRYNSMISFQRNLEECYRAFKGERFASRAHTHTLSRLDGHLRRNLGNPLSLLAAIIIAGNDAHAVIHFNGSAVGALVFDTKKFGYNTAIDKYAERTNIVNYRRKDPSRLISAERSEEVAKALKPYENVFKRRYATREDIAPIWESVKSDECDTSPSPLDHLNDIVKDKPAAKKDIYPSTPKRISTERFVLEMLPKAKELYAYIDGANHPYMDFRAPFGVLSVPTSEDVNNIFRWSDETAAKANHIVSAFPNSRNGFASNRGLEVTNVNAISTLKVDVVVNPPWCSHQDDIHDGYLKSTVWLGFMGEFQGTALDMPAIGGVVKPELYTYRGEIDHIASKVEVANPGEPVCSVLQINGATLFVKTDEGNYNLTIDDDIY